MGVLDQANKDFEYEIVDEFINHFEVMKDAMQPAILALENADEYGERVNELFRIFHNLKSASAYLKFEAIFRLSEFIESALDEARSSKGPASETYVDWLLKVCDQYAIWFVDLVNDRDRFTPIAHGELFDTPHLL
ncbi:MAG: Hpt domain-containing protein [Helicobacteraceae bacterium]|jgi:two-component system chemotaxis sensor kinase CheA|nr:Hpt domain-containing protein [Helicobacteraceae bacterium]